MKARVKATGEIVSVYNWGDPTFRADNGEIYQKSELDFDVEDENNPNYWDRLLHQYAGMAMQGIMANSLFMPYDGKEIADLSNDIATALVNKLKESKV